MSASFFDGLGVKPVIGPTFTDADDLLGAPAVLILSYSYWQDKLGRDPSVIGRRFEMNDKVHTVGVLPPIPGWGGSGGLPCAVTTGGGDRPDGRPAIELTSIRATE